MSKKILRGSLSDEIMIAMVRLVDDVQVDTREPSHTDIGFQIQRCGLDKAVSVKYFTHIQNRPNIGK